MMAPLANLVFHHMGVACANLSEEIAHWTALGYSPEGEVFEDLAQGIRGLFMVGGGPRLELLEATPGSTTLAPWIKRAVKFYHAGYLTPDLDAAIQVLSARGASIARAPMMSVYFRSRIAFLMMPNMALIEVIENVSPHSVTEPAP